MTIPALSLKQFRYLVALAETGHFKQAATRCGISQPSLSVQIQNLEDALGTRLVERGRAVVLTPVGREVVERARTILLDVQSLADFASASQHKMVGTIRLGVKPTLGPYFLPNVVAALHRAHPELKLYIREGSPQELESELARGVHDVILAQLPIKTDGLVAERLFREPIYLSVSAAHPLATQETTTTKDLKGLPILSLAPDFHLHHQVHAICQEFGATLIRDYEGTSLDALRQMVAMEMGATFLPALYVRSELPDTSDVVVRKLEDRALFRSIGLAWRKGAGRAKTYTDIAAVIRSLLPEQFDMLVLEN